MLTTKWLFRLRRHQLHLPGIHNWELINLPVFSVTANFEAALLSTSAEMKAIRLTPPATRFATWPSRPNCQLSNDSTKEFAFKLITISYQVNRILIVIFSSVKSMHRNGRLLDWHVHLFCVFWRCSRWLIFFIVICSLLMQQFTNYC